MQVENNQIYVMPAAAILTIENRRLRIRKDNGRRERKPIDIFLSSLAVDIGEFAGGVILSGGDGDGTLGVKAIKERGGITFAQTADGFGPQHPDMPDSAISSGLVDFAIPVDQMGPRLAEFAQSVVLSDAMATGAEAGETQKLWPRFMESCAIKSGTTSVATSQRRSCVACSGACKSRG